MIARGAGFYIGALLVLGAGWGLTVPLSKIAVSTGHGFFGLIFWDASIGAALLALIVLLRGRTLPLGRRSLQVFVVIALVGTLIPNAAFYQAVRHLPAGVMAILLSLVPMLAFPVALALRIERFSARRLGGLLAGLAGVLLLVAPTASLPDPAMLLWVPVALVSACCYAFEGNYVARWGIAGMTPIQALLGATLVAATLALPMAVGTGQFISPLRSYGAAEWALIGAAILHVLTYTGYVWLVTKTGAVFAVQVSYLVTGFGVLASLVILGESYSRWIWAALALVLLGVYLVQPRREGALAPGASIGETARQPKPRVLPMGRPEI